MFSEYQGALSATRLIFKKSWIEGLPFAKYKSKFLIESREWVKIFKLKFTFGYSIILFFVIWRKIILFGVVNWPIVISLRENK